MGCITRHHVIMGRKLFTVNDGELHPKLRDNRFACFVEIAPNWQVSANVNDLRLSPTRSPLVVT